MHQGPIAMPAVKCHWGKEPVTGTTTGCGVLGLCLDEWL